MGANTSIILVTAYDWSDIEDDAKISGADGFICKPLFKSYLSEKIGHALKLEEGRNDITESKNDDFNGLNVLVAEDISACLAAGMDGHVAKPVDMDKLCQEIRRVLNGRGA